MSLETWKAEFYPVNAFETTQQNALDHSIKKWEGLTPENTKKHRVVFNGDYLAPTRATKKDETTNFPIDWSTCALCRFYLLGSNEDNHYGGECMTCPITTVTGETCEDTYDQFLHSLSKPEHPQGF